LNKGAGVPTSSKAIVFLHDFGFSRESWFKLSWFGDDVSD
jgi:hypothetical protein